MNFLPIFSSYFGYLAFFLVLFGVFCFVLRSKEDLILSARKALQIRYMLLYSGLLIYACLSAKLIGKVMFPELFFDYGWVLLWFLVVALPFTARYLLTESASGRLISTFLDVSFSSILLAILNVKFESNSIYWAFVLLVLFGICWLLFGLHRRLTSTFARFMSSLFMFGASIIVFPIFRTDIQGNSNFSKSLMLMVMSVGLAMCFVPFVYIVELLRGRKSTEAFIN